MAGMRKTWRIAEFRALLISYVINRAGDVIGALALAVATAAGPVLGGAVLALLGASTALAADGASFLIAALLITCAPGLRARAASSDSGGPTRRRALRATFGYIAGHPALRALVF